VVEHFPAHLSVEAICLRRLDTTGIDGGGHG
jgi:hypothetical protein